MNKIKTKRVYQTKKRRAKQQKLKSILMLTVIMLSAGAIGMAGNITAYDTATIDWRARRVLPVNEDKATQNSIIRETTMYNSTVEQTDSTPCISADGTNICEVDYNICATNAYPFGTMLKVDKLGVCIVKDRMNSRFKERLDWYAGMDIARAVNFGLQNLLVEEVIN